MKYTFLFIFLFTIISATKAQISIESHNNAVENFNKAILLLEQKNFQAAFPLFAATIASDSTFRAAYIHVTQAAFESRQTDVARLCLEKGITVFSDDDEIIYYLAKIYQLERKYQQAIDTYSMAIEYAKVNGEEFPIVYDYYAGRGTCYLIQKQFEKALSDFDYSIKLDDTKSAVYNNRGQALYQLKRHNEACQSWQKARDLGDNNAETYIKKLCLKTI